MSSFIWGGTQSGTSGTEAKLVQGENFNHFLTILVILTILTIFDPFRPYFLVLGTSSTSSTPMEDPFEKVVYVLTANSFQKWLLSQGKNFDNFGPFFVLFHYFDHFLIFFSR